jgi:hypothetical protein
MSRGILLLLELWHGCGTLFGLTFFARFENILTYGELIEWQGPLSLARAIDHNIVKGVLMLVVTDNQVCAGHPSCSKRREVVLFDDKEMPQVEKAQLIVERIRIGVHPAVTDGTFPVRAMVILALIRVLRILVEVEIVVEEVAVHQDCRDHGRAIGTEKCEEIEARHLDCILPDLYEGFATGETAIVVDGKTAGIFAICPLDELLDFKTEQ